MQRESFWIKSGHFFFLFFVMNLIGLVAYSYMTPETLVWYSHLPKPSLTPPNAYFGIAWTILFFLISLSGAWLWDKASFFWFKGQVVFIFLWSFCFFFLHLPQVAFYVLLLLIICEIETILTFYPKSKGGSLLLIPLLVWSLFALYLNGVIIL